MSAGPVPQPPFVWRVARELVGHIVGVVLVVCVWWLTREERA